MRSIQVVQVVAILGAAFLAGCGPKGRELTIVPLAGAVTLDGTPLQDGVVELSDRTTGFSASGVLDPDGKFTIDRVPTGTYEIVVRPPYLPPPGEIVPPRPATMGPIRTIPKKYQVSSTSGFTVTVKPEGVSNLVLELTK